MAAIDETSPRVRMLRGDCREVLRTLPDESVHCCVTSPPYFGLRDYQVAGQIGLEPTPAAYVAELVAVFREVRRVLRKDGTVWLVIGDSFAGGGGHSPKAPSSAFSKSGKYGEALKEGGIKPIGSIKAKDLIGIPWRVAFALQDDGWWLRQDIIWSKPNPMPESVTDRCTKAHEYIFLLTKSARYYYDATAIAEPASWPEGPWGGRNPRPGIDVNGGGQANSDAFGKGLEKRNKRSVWHVATAPYADAHFATFPPALIEPCILAGCPRECCSECGAPWVREVERTLTQPGVTGGATPYDSGRPDGMTLRAGGFGGGSNQTLGWSPSCPCGAPTVPGTCLDPFAGAGTTGLVADRLQRNAILIELNEEYARMAESRIQRDAPLFAQVST